MDYFLTLEFDWTGAWIGAWAMVLIQFLFMAIYKEAGRRAVDTSWYKKRDKLYAAASTVMQVLLLIISFFTPFKLGTAYFFFGALLYVLCFVAFLASCIAYAEAPRDELIQNGIYKYSRNPMYTFFLLGMLALCIASASLWLLLIVVPFFIFSHLTILGEERYCTETYGEAFIQYKAKTPRYLFV